MGNPGLTNLGKSQARGRGRPQGKVVPAERFRGGLKKIMGNKAMIIGGI